MPDALDKQIAALEAAVAFLTEYGDTLRTTSPPFPAAIGVSHDPRKGVEVLLSEAQFDAAADDLGTPVDAPHSDGWGQSFSHYGVVRVFCLRAVTP